MDELDFSKLPGRLRALVWLSGGKVRWRTIQIILDAGYVDGYRLRHTAAAGYTFPTGEPHVRLDFLFLPQPYAGTLKSCEVMDVPRAREASDHLPLLSVLDLSREANPSAVGPAVTTTVDEPARPIDDDDLTP